MAKDFYATLGVSKTADEKQIKNAYRKLAREHHPDVNPNNPRSEERFKEISAAYETLADPEKRKLYDQFGENYDKIPPGYSSTNSANFPGGYRGQGVSGVSFEELFAQAQKGGAGAPNFGGAGGFRAGEAGGLGDVLGSLFGGARRRGPEKGGDVEQPVEVSFVESVTGTQRHLSFIIRGENGREEKRDVKVKIPALINDGSTIKISGRGASSPNGGSNGDLLLRVRVRPDDFWKRDGLHLEIEVPVTFSEAAVGAQIQIPTQKGEVGLKIPAGTQSGQKFRLRERGLKNEKNGETGDLFVVARIGVPKNLSERERELIEELAKLRAETGRENLPKGF